MAHAVAAPSCISTIIQIKQNIVVVKSAPLITLLPPLTIRPSQDNLPGEKNRWERQMVNKIVREITIFLGLVLGASAVFGFFYGVHLLMANLTS